jgi:dTDP-4-dehydrorhamnose reductase
MLGYAIDSALGSAFDVFALKRVQLDITDKTAVDLAIKSIKPDIIINTAAFTNADECESQQDRAMLVNGIAVGYLAQAAHTIGSKVIHISTDYIFDGSKGSKYIEDDKPNPLSVYGQSKLMGEQELRRFTDNYVIIRTQWMFGEHGSNFVDTILRIAKEKDEIKVVDDQYGCPTYTKDIANVIRLLIGKKDIKAETIHFSNAGIVSRFGLAQGILRLAGIQTRIVPVTTAVLQRPAKRPNNSALDKTKIKKLLTIDIRPWQEALNEYMRKKRNL